MKFIDKIVASSRLRMTYGITMLFLATLASRLPDLAVNALILGAIGLYFTVSGIASARR